MIGIAKNAAKNMVIIPKINLIPIAFFFTVYTAFPAIKGAEPNNVKMLSRLITS